MRIEPEDLAARYDEHEGDRCEFQVISQHSVWGDFQRAKLWPEPGAAYTLLPMLRVGERSRHAIGPF